MDNQRILTSTKTFCVYLLVTVVSILLVFCASLLLLVLAPCLLFRWCVAKCAKYMKRDTLDKMLTATGHIMSIGSVYECPKNVIVVAFELEGKPDIFHLRDSIQKRFLDARNDKGELKHPELRQNLVTWMGFHFWKCISNFKLDEHVYMYSDNGSDATSHRPDVNSLVKFHLEKWWSRNKALWEIVIIPGEQLSWSRESPEGCFLLLARFHHGIVDGYSVMKLILSLDTSITSLESKPNFRTVGNYRPNRWISIFKSPWDVTYNSLFSPTLQLNPFLDKNKSLSGASSRAAVSIPLNEIKDVKNKFEISFTSVLVSMMAGGLKKYFASRKLEEGLAFRIPMPGKHSDKLRNTLSFVTVTVQMMESDPLKRVLKINQDLVSMKLSTIPSATRMLTVVGGCIPPSLITSITSNSIQSQYVVVSNVPGPERLEICGHKTRDINFSTTVAGTGGIIFGILTSFNKLSITVGADTAYIPSDEDAAELLSLCVQELTLLKLLKGPHIQAQV